MAKYIRSLDAFPGTTDQIFVGELGGKSAAYAGSPLQTFQSTSYSLAHAQGLEAGRIRIVDVDASPENYGIYEDSGVTEVDAGGNTLHLFKMIVDQPINNHSVE